MSHNIEKSQVHKGLYVGYSGRLKWVIKKHGNMWTALAKDERTGKAHSISATTLKSMSEKLEDYEAPFNNPAPRKGTKKPLRASQITKKAPTKRLVARRKANTEQGYFPNPIEIANAYANLPFCVQQQVSTTKAWNTIAAFKDREDAEWFTKEFSKKHKNLTIRLIKE